MENLNAVEVRESKRNKKHSVYCVKKNAYVVTGEIMKHEDTVKTYRDRLTFIFKPLLRVKVHYLPP